MNSNDTNQISHPGAQRLSDAGPSQEGLLSLELSEWYATLVRVAEDVACYSSIDDYLVKKLRKHMMNKPRQSGAITFPPQAECP